METLLIYHSMMIGRVKSDFHRYLYDEIDWNDHLIGIVGPRGVGKTTLVLQHIKERLNRNTALYVTAEDLYFANHTMLSLAKELTDRGFTHLIIDEIHKYPEWSRELKLISDYHSELYVIFTGSSILDIRKGANDLSRRAVMYAMQGLSFREYLKMFHNIDVPVYSVEQIASHQADTGMVENPLPLFRQYLRTGYYPFSRERSFDRRLRGVITQTLEVDIPFFARMNASTGYKLKRLLTIISESAPFKPNFTKIATLLDVSRNVIADYVLMLEEAGMAMQLRDGTGGLRGLGKVEKVYLDNPNIIYNLSPTTAEIGNVRETFFLNQMRVRNNVVFSGIADFQIGDFTFEVGGRRKGQQQIEQASHGFIVKDDIEQPMLNIIPLWHFGLNY
ncbi:MAG: ATP-binding protein [Prevotellaceae bacterium]|nr:ATP-binding protein [Prevotellaceae bacterium]